MNRRSEGDSFFFFYDFRMMLEETRRDLRIVRQPLSAAEHHQRPKVRFQNHERG